MVSQVIWSKKAVSDLEEIANFISKNSEYYAAAIEPTKVSILGIIHGSFEIIFIQWLVVFRKYTEGLLSSEALPW